MRRAIVAVPMSDLERILGTIPINIAGPMARHGAVKAPANPKILRVIETPGAASQRFVEFLVESETFVDLQDELMCPTYPVRIGEPRRSGTED